MPLLVFESFVTCSAQQLWDFHSDVNTLKILTPPGTQVDIIGPETAVTDGALHILRIKKSGLPLVWKARIHGVRPPYEFFDTAEKSPFKSWSHHHEFIEKPAGCVLLDSISYELPYGPLGRIIDHFVLRKDIDAMFQHRHEVTKGAFRREN